MDDLTDRQRGLLGYFATIALDPGVRAAFETRSIAKISSAIGACVREDLPAVVGIMAKRLREIAKPHAKKKAESFAQAITTGTPRPFGAAVEAAFANGVDGLFDLAERLVSGKRRR